MGVHNHQPQAALGIDGCATGLGAAELHVPVSIDYNKYVIVEALPYTIEYYSKEVQDAVLRLPDRLAARYLFLTKRMERFGASLGPPHTAPLGDGLFELRLKAAEGIARVMYCAVSGKRVIMLHVLIKKSQKTPKNDLAIARARMKEIHHANS
ncbi:MAG: type II toxin-antitoxin system RelE/ParE family toxin [Betaproteobacteria bacterium]